jgi:hypothetical protein
MNPKKWKITAAIMFVALIGSNVVALDLRGVFCRVMVRAPG